MLSGREENVKEEESDTLLDKDESPTPLGTQIKINKTNELLR